MEEKQDLSQEQCGGAGQAVASRPPIAGREALSFQQARATMVMTLMCSYSIPQRHGSFILLAVLCVPILSFLAYNNTFFIVTSFPVHKIHA